MFNIYYKMFNAYFQIVLCISQKRSMCSFKLFSVYHKKVQCVFSNCSVYITRRFNVYLKNVHCILRKCSMYNKKCSMVGIFSRSVTTFSSFTFTQNTNHCDAVAEVVRIPNNLSYGCEFESLTWRSFLGFFVLPRCDVREWAGPFRSRSARKLVFFTPTSVS